MATLEPPSPQLEALRDRDHAVDLRPRADRITDGVVGRMVRDVPAFANAPRMFVDVTRIVVSRIVDQVLLLFVEARFPTRQELTALVEICVPPTDRGVTLEDMLRVFRIAQDELWWELRRLVADGELSDPASALELSQVGVALITDLSRGVSAAYLKGDRVWLQRRDAERALVTGLLDTPPRVDEATRAARSLDLRVFGTWRVGAYAHDDGADLDRLAAALEDARTTWGIRCAVAVHGDVVVVAAQGDDVVPPPPGARGGIGRAGEAAAGLRRSYDQALSSLEVARRAGVQQMTAEEARLGRVVLGLLPPTAMADALLAPIDAEPEGRREMLLETLAAWLDAQGSPSVTADALQLHVQSTRYRIDQLRQVLGDALDDADQRLLLHLAVAARRLEA